MNSKIIFLYFSFLSIISYSEIGSLEEVIFQSINSKHVFLDNILIKLNQELEAFAHSQNNQASEENKIAYLLTKHSLLKVVKARAEAIASRTSWAKNTVSFDAMLAIFALSPLVDTLRETQSKVDKIAEESEITVAVNAAFEILLLAGMTALYSIEQPTVKVQNNSYLIIAHNIAQWVLFNKIITKFQDVIPDIFYRILKYVQERHQN